MPWKECSVVEAVAMSIPAILLPSVETRVGGNGAGAQLTSAEHRPRVYDPITPRNPALAGTSESNLKVECPGGRGGADWIF
jgi:hypothetical protein